MATELFARGLESGGAPELWNVEHPDRVTAVHADYVGAGSDIVLTNSFGGTGFRLKLHQLDDRVIELNEAAARVARAAVDASDRRVIVAGSMGPTGELLEPMGSLTMKTCAAAFRRTSQRTRRWWSRRTLDRDDESPRRDRWSGHRCPFGQRSANLRDAELRHGWTNDDGGHWS